MSKSTLPPRSAAFPGFGPRALGFLKALAFHQDKTWFEENRGLYESELKTPLQALVESLTGEFERIGLPLRGDGRSIFRLHRDTRFSKDKRPYKTNAGAVLSRDGTKRSQGLLYIHIDPEGCFAAAGFWRPEPEEVLALRRGIVGKPDAFRATVAKLGKSNLVLGDPLSRPPKGFEDCAEEDLAAAVKMRNLLVRRPIAPTAIHSPDLARQLVAFAQDAEPLLRFGWAALDTHRPA
ncbi:TIGR02453 family protein [Enterovirga aerilata]|uniref:TIGR02453 family protein n=1 Tax=Enterovirga aerilata TaxID=2730920 RepID=A0A849IEB8_9HYPH|nr:TIGR02453 family protein [Enterovirga sp. DB1703]NNM74317.1 TIGR02453 family protein [Enterovirga sp. DB1703]